jgi:acylphosphatase
MTRKRVIASGAVQGVYFRDTCRRMAIRHGVGGWVRNRPDGKVEAVFEGPEANVDRLVDWARHGPRGARVDHLEVFDESPAGLEGFTIRL